MKRNRGLKVLATLRLYCGLALGREGVLRALRYPVAGEGGEKQAQVQAAGVGA